MSQKASSTNLNFRHTVASSMKTFLVSNKTKRNQPDTARTAAGCATSIMNKIVIWGSALQSPLIESSRSITTSDRRCQVNWGCVTFTGRSLGKVLGHPRESNRFSPVIEPRDLRAGPHARVRRKQSRASNDPISNPQLGTQLIS